MLPACLTQPLPYFQSKNCLLVKFSVANWPSSPSLHRLPIQKLSSSQIQRARFLSSDSSLQTSYLKIVSWLKTVLPDCLSSVSSLNRLPIQKWFTGRKSVARLSFLCLFTPTSDPQTLSYTQITRHSKLSLQSFILMPYSESLHSLPTPKLSPTPK